MLLIINAAQIVTMSGPIGPRRGKAMGEIGCLGKDHAVLMNGEKIEAVGPYAQVRKKTEGRQVQELDAAGRVMMPGFVDSHSHAVFAASRLKDFEMRAQGAGYEQIAAQGGGIKRSVEDLRAAPEKNLEVHLERWARRALSYGITTMEIKSGYGLELEAERKMLSVMASVKTPLEIIPTFLGAHALAKEYEADREGYIDYLCERMIPELSGLAKFCDIFCDEGYFNRDEARRILLRAQELGYGLKLHAEQLHHTGGAYLGYKLGAVSVDHLDCITDGDMKFLAGSDTMATLCPGSNFFLATKRYPPARKMIDKGLAVALATDFNPGTSPTVNMSFILSLAVNQMKLKPEEALVAATINGAHALALGRKLGSLEAGKQADLIVLDVSDYREIPYYFAVNMVCGVVKKGHVVFWNG
ncbi:MAG: imidazolonepropionase [Elusimicrobia bacterium]|nr:imidazolonepropionase [Elusimicrobiota bacterium]